MHKKSEAFHYYKMFANYAQTHTGRKIKVLRSDRGGEYLSDEFQTHLDECGTQHQMTSAYTPEQNGVAERLNRTLMNLVRSMLAHKTINNRFWAEALATAVYVRNRVTSSVLPPNTTPHHKWMGKAPNVGHIRVFGSKCWYTLPKVKVRKLDPRAREALFLGYVESSRAYKLWDGELQKVVISRDVVFDEFSSGVCGNVGDANTLDTDEDIVSLDIENDNNTSDNSPSSETPESESGESSNSEPSDEELHESPDSTSPKTETPPSPSDDSSESGELPTNQVHSQQQPRPEPRRSGLVRNPVSEWWKAMYSAGITSHAHVATNIPNFYKQPVNGPKVAFWKKGIDKELASHRKNRTWTLVPRSDATNFITSRWVFNVKQLPDGNGTLCEAAKARLVARGFQQIEGIDYSETFAPVIKFTTIRLRLALVAHFDLELHQMDVVTAFLNGDLDEDIYMEQPEGYVDGTNPDFVCQLLKAIYGVQQAHRQWHYKIDSFLLIELGFKTTRSDPCLYIKREGNSVMIIAIGDMGVCEHAIPCCMVVCDIWHVKTKVAFLDGLFLRGPRFVILLAVS